MRFLYIKNEQVCYHCGATLLYGEEAVVIRIRHSNGVIIPQFFHSDPCYEVWNQETYVKRLLNWREGATKRPLRKPKAVQGRPRKYKDSLKATRLKSLLHYHRKMGNTDKVEILEEMLEQQEIEKAKGGIE